MASSLIKKATESKSFEKNYKNQTKFGMGSSSKTSASAAKKPTMTALNAGQSSKMRENFLKVNKGLRNRSIHCYANSCMQALMACPAFFQMLRHAKSIINDEKQPLGPVLAKKELLNKFIKLSDKFFPGTEDEVSEEESTTTLQTIKEEESTKDNSAELQANGTSLQIDSN